MLEAKQIAATDGMLEFLESKQTRRFFGLRHDAFMRRFHCLRNHAFLPWIVLYFNSRVYVCIYGISLKRLTFVEN